MRNALLAVAAVVAAVFAGWILDDKILGGDIARNTSISGVEVGRLDIDEAAELARAVAKPISDKRGPAEYRRSLVGTLTRRVLRSARNRAQLPSRP